MGLVWSFACLKNTRLDIKLKNAHNPLVTKATYSKILALKKENKSRGATTARLTAMLHSFREMSRAKLDALWRQSDSSDSPRWLKQ